MRAPAQSKSKSSNTMSMTTIDPVLSWKQADDDVHVATRDGEFAGFVEFDGSAHLGRDRHGNILGTYASFADAQEAVARALTAPVRTSRLTLLRRLRRARA